MRIGIISCEAIRQELDALLCSRTGITIVEYLDSALHVDPRNMSEIIRSRINAISDSVDVIFLGYGKCRSLQGIEDEFEIPIFRPQVDDCINLFLTPPRYKEEIKKEAGTWFMPPAWTQIGVDAIISELHLERATHYGKEPFDIAKHLFKHYRRGLFINTGVGDEKAFRTKAQEFCSKFGLEFDETDGSIDILRESLDRCFKYNIIE